MNTEAFDSRLRSAGLKLTSARQAVLRVLTREHRLRTIDELVRELNRRGKRRYDWSTVYRCVRKFEDTGLVESVTFTDGQVRYGLKDADGHHHHHVICTECKNTTPLTDCTLAKLQDSVTSLGFTAVTHRLEFFGVCANCR